MGSDDHIPYWLSLAASASQVEAESARERGYHRIELGSIRITALYDGAAKLPIETLLTRAAPGEVEDALAGRDLCCPAGISVNTYLIEEGDKLVLIDAGAGANFGSDCGLLPGHLAAAGYRPEQIDAVLLTHIHSDHTGGLVLEGRVAFPNAELFVSRADLDYWFDPIEEARATGERKKMFEKGKSGVRPYRDAGRVTAFDEGAEVLPGVWSVPAPGHTPGHTMYRVESDGHAVVFFGDLVHSAEVQMPDPAVAIKFDTDELQAVASRNRWLPQFARDGTLTAGAHTDFPGFGHVVPTDFGFAWLPLPIQSVPPGEPSAEDARRLNRE